MKRFLLPFTHGIHLSAINQALLFARAMDAILVPLSVICYKHNKPSHVRLEHIQQSKDFLVLVQQRAKRLGVTIELAECYSYHAATAIEYYARITHCSGVLLFTAGEKGLLLPREIIGELTAERRNHYYVIDLPVRARTLSLPAWLKWTKPSAMIKQPEVEHLEKIYLPTHTSTTDTHISSQHQ